MYDYYSVAAVLSKNVKFMGMLGRGGMLRTELHHVPAVQVEGQIESAKWYKLGTWDSDAVEEQEEQESNQTPEE